MGGGQGASEVSFGVLGPIEVSVAGVPVGIMGVRRRALLARLLIDANRVVPAERLIEDLWFESPPDHPVNALQAYVSHLRSVLEPGRVGPAHVLVTCRPGYVLVVGPERVDAARFVGLVAEGRAALGLGQAAAAAGLLGEALGLWRGLPLAEFADEGWARPEVARLVDLRWAAVEDRLEADLALGRHAAVVGEAEAAVAEQPLRERLWAHRMLALYRCGRQAEALRAYSELRRVLGEGLGIEPSPELARLEEAILVHKPDLEWRPEDPASAISVESRGRRPPPLLLQSGPLPLVGRAAELDRLRQAWVAAGDGPRAVLLTGEPGVGKTRLASEIAGSVFTEGGLVLAGRCDEEMGVPYQPLVEALRHYVDGTADRDLAAQLGPTAGELTRVLPELAGRLPQLVPPVASDPETERYRLFVAIADWVTAASRVTPVLLVIDDLHWATKPTFLLLRHILRAAESARLMVVATYRDTERSQNPSVADQMTALARERGVADLHLEGLGDVEVAELVSAAGGGDSTELARAIHVQTRGNPFFVGEVVRHLIETGGPSEGKREVRAGLGLPAGVRAVVADRLAGVAPATRKVLAVAAVAGLDFELPVVRAAAGCSGEAVIGALDEAQHAHLIEETPGPVLGYRFVHGLVQATIYDQTSRARRADQHRRVGDAIETVHAGHLEDHLPNLARHFGEAAVDGDRNKAVSYAQAAGDAALAQLAHDEAALHYQQALDVLAHGGQATAATASSRAHLLVLLGEAQRRAGDPEYRATLLNGAELASALGDAALLARATLANNRGFFSLTGTVDAERVRVLEQALAAQGPGASPDRARLLAQLGTELIFSGDWATRDALSNQALAMAKSLGEPGTIVHVLNLRFATLWAAPTLTERIKTASEARHLAAHLDDPVPGFYANLFSVHAALEAGELATARITLAEAGQAATGLGQPIIDWYVAVTTAKLALLSASPDEAEGLVMHALAVGQEAGQPDALQWAWGQLAVIRRHQGRAAEIAAFTEAYAAQSLAGSMPMLVRAGLAAAYCQDGRLEEAKSTVEALTADDFNNMPCDFGWLATAALCAQVCWRVGGCQGAEAIHDLLVPYRDQFVDAGPGWLGSVAHYIGLTAAALGRIDEANDAFAQAADAHTRLGAHTWLAATQAAWAELLIHSGELRKGTSLLTDAHAAAELLGMGEWERHTAANLAQLNHGTHN